MSATAAAAQDEVARLNEVLASGAGHVYSADECSRCAAVVVDVRSLPDDCRLQHLTELLADAQLQVLAFKRPSPISCYLMFVFLMCAAASKRAGATG